MEKIEKSEFSEFDTQAKKIIEEVGAGNRPDISACLLRLDELRDAMSEDKKSMIMIMAISDAFKFVIESAHKDGKKIDAFNYFELFMSSLVKLELDGVIKINL